jgi:hypothetical protein
VALNIENAEVEKLVQEVAWMPGCDTGRSSLYSEASSWPAARNSG